jgi:hypothetical protein
MIGAYALWIAAGCLTIGILWLLIDWAIIKFSKWRERRAMHIRDTAMRRWGFARYEKSARERRL